MGTLRKTSTGHIYQFVGLDRKRRSIRLSGFNKKAAGNFYTHVEAIIQARRLNEPIDNATMSWVSRLPDDMHGRLANIGLIPARQNATLRAFVDAYIEKRTDVTESTRVNFRQARRSLLQHFDGEMSLRDITEEDAADYRRWLELPEGGNLAEATASRRTKRAKQFLQSAVRSRIIDRNPFDGVRMGKQDNSDRQFFIDREATKRIIAACPDARWRLIFAMCRYGGLRCPSELVGLRWSDINLAGDRFTIQSPKTIRHGKPSRVCPIFTELRPYLEEAWELLAEAGEDRVFPDMGKGKNLRTTAGKILRRAGVEQWPRLFQNMRSSRETELCEEFPIQVVTSWMGNSPEIARKHYLQVTDDHFAKAANAEKSVTFLLRSEAVSSDTEANGINGGKKVKSRNLV